MNAYQELTRIGTAAVKEENASVNTENTDSSRSLSSDAPRNAPKGGVWGTMKYNGEKSRKRNRVGCVFLLIPGLVMMGCPKDEKDAYAVWEKVR